MSLVGACLGLMLMAGLLLVGARLPLARRLHLADRIAPYVRDSAPPSALLSGPERRRPLYVQLVAPALSTMAGRVDRVVGGSASVRRRLAALGSPLGVEAFRQEQVVWSAVGVLAGLALLALRAATGVGPPLFSLVALTVAALFGGVFLRDVALTRAVRRREELIALELPSIAELLALAVGAGESPVAALERATRRTDGELSRELRIALAEARAGAPFVQALAGVADRTSLPALARFVDGITVALQRGTPLADVLRAQAVDVREAGRRDLLEAGGKREIAMMVPVVFREGFYSGRRSGVRYVG